MPNPRLLEMMKADLHRLKTKQPVFVERSVESHNSPALDAMTDRWAREVEAAERRIKRYEETGVIFGG